MTTETGRPSGGGPPAEPETLDELITALTELRRMGWAERARRARHLNRHVVQGVLKEVAEEAVREGLATGLKPAVVAEQVGVHPSNVWGKKPKVTPS